MLNIRVVCGSLGFTAAISFLVCVLWGLLTPGAVHMHGFLELVLPGFTWLSGLNFLLGFVESFLFGIYFGAVYVPIHNFMLKRVTAKSAA